MDSSHFFQNSWISAKLFKVFFFCDSISTLDQPDNQGTPPCLGRYYPLPASHTLLVNFHNTNKRVCMWMDVCMLLVFATWTWMGAVLLWNEKWSSKFCGPWSSMVNCSTSGPVLCGLMECKAVFIHICKWFCYTVRFAGTAAPHITCRLRSRRADPHWGDEEVGWSWSLVWNNRRGFEFMTMLNAKKVDWVYVNERDNLG